MQKISNRGFFIAVVLLVGCLLWSCQKKDQRVMLSEGNPAPLFALRDTQNRSWNLNELKGKVILINFWASWCKPCRQEMPSLQRLQKKMKNNSDFLIITVLFKEDAREALQFLKSNNINLPVLLDTDLSASKAYGVTGVPETYVVDKKGILRKKIIGPADFDTPALNFTLSSLIHE